ncbi:O-antigen ligase [Emticicia sp. BO119]|uniref:O-antigen ligase family protein n=1 Tax=Emticicia sp. BO119 TaxID=2757768 RepID=UPI0015F00147|nr:O-antigen ligase family protein [Emticicia sp. BO119]MBA4854114.1 O-antigen ligase family protein [Emticicia sp. BO119]
MLRISFKKNSLILSMLIISGGIGTYLFPINILGGNLFAFRIIVVIIFINIMLKHINMIFGLFNSLSLFIFKMLIFIWFFIPLITLFLVSNSKIALINYFNIVFGLITFIVILFYLKNFKNSLSILVKSISFICIINLVINYIELITFKHLDYTFVDSLPDYAKEIPIAYGFFGNPNNNAYFLCLSLPILYLDFNNNKKKVILISLLTFISILFSSSRLSFIGLLIFWSFMFFANFNKNKKTFISIFITLLGFLVFYIKDIITLLELNALIISSDNYNTSSSEVRLQHFHNMFYYLKETYGFGLGPGGYESLGNNMRGHPESISPHNFFVEVFTDYGILIGVLLSISLTIRIFLERKSTNKRINFLLTLFGILFLILSPQNSGYLKNQITWMFLAIVFSNFNDNEFNTDEL